MPIWLSELQFDPKVDIGHFLTFLTLLAGFILWLYTTISDRRRRSEDDARSGALRLMLKILREAREPLTTGELFQQFQSNEKRSERKVYCGRDWKFKSETQFETALYRLHWESKIEFYPAKKSGSV
jgi:hypothetical protein